MLFEICQLHLYSGRGRQYIWVDSLKRSCILQFRRRSLLLAACRQRFTLRMFLLPIWLKHLGSWQSLFNMWDTSTCGLAVLSVAAVHRWGVCGALVESTPFVQRVMGSTPALAATLGTLGKSFTHSCLWRFGTKFRHSIRAVSGAPLSSSGLEEAL